MKASISFIIPVYNERNSIENTIKEARKILRKSGRKFQIIVVNDGSDDETEKILENIKNIEVINHSVNRGYGAALKSGIKKANGDWIAIVDADQTYPIDRFIDMFKEMETADMVIAARTGKKVSILFFRQIGKWILKMLSNFLTNQKIPDLNSGMRVFKKEFAVRFLKLFPDGFSFTTTITIAALCNGYSVKYVSINYFKRKGKSTIHPIKDFIGFFQLIIRLVLYFKPINVFFPVSIFFFLIGFSKMLVDAIKLSHFGIGGVALVLLSIQILFLGLLADLIITRSDL